VPLAAIIEEATKAVVGQLMRLAPPSSATTLGRSVAVISTFIECSSTPLTDAASSEAQGYCILDHTVAETGCSATLLHSRVVPRHATELTAVFLDRKVTAILGQRRNTRISRQQREELAAVIHLCGAGPATAFARRGFRLMPGERCGDHDVAAYVAQINTMKRKFLSLAVEK
jgi:hypothetical protein